jgi:hypothetical protein
VAPTVAEPGSPTGASRERLPAADRGGDGCGRRASPREAIQLYTALGLVMNRASRRGESRPARGASMATRLWMVLRVLVPRASPADFGVRLIAFTALMMAASIYFSTNLLNRLPGRARWHCRFVLLLIRITMESLANNHIRCSYF